MTHNNYRLTSEDCEILELTALEVIKLQARQTPAAELNRKLRRITASREGVPRFLKFLESFFFDSEDGKVTTTYRDLFDKVDPGSFLKTARDYPLQTYQAISWALNALEREAEIAELLEDEE